MSHSNAKRRLAGVGIAWKFHNNSGSHFVMIRGERVLQWVYNIRAHPPRFEEPGAEWVDYVIKNTIVTHGSIIICTAPNHLSSFMQSTLPVLGLVGGIGSGKSYIASLFARRGAFVLDADKFGHEALLQPAIKQQIRTIWGDEVFTADGEVDRKKLGHRVFSQPDEKLKLEALVFPYIGQAIQQALEQAEKNRDIKLAILDAAILLETGWKQHCTAVIFVDASLPVRLERVARRGWSEEEFTRREATQWPLEKKKRACQHIIPNEGDEVFTERLVNDLIIRYSRQ